MDSISKLYIDNFYDLIIVPIFKTSFLSREGKVLDLCGFIVASVGDNERKQRM